MKVVSYSCVVPTKNNSFEKEELLKRFLTGVAVHGDKTIYHNNYNLLECDVAVIQGWQHRLGKIAPHLKLRKQVIDHQLANKKFVCVADSNLFLYATKNNAPHHYLRYSFNGVFPNTGIYCNDTAIVNRWQQISRDLEITVEPKKSNGKTILICLQRSGGWSMGSVTMNTWITDTVNTIKKYTDRTIILRPHPKDNNAAQYLKRIKNIKISTGRTLDEDLQKAWCVVNHNSSSIVGAVIKGYPAFITDSNSSQCRDVADTDFSKIETPSEFDREKWLQRISQFHWKFSELEDGSCWKHMRNYCQ